MAYDDIIRTYLEFSSNASSVLDSVTSKVDSVGDRISKVGQGFLPFSLGAAAALGGAVKLAIDFDKALQSASRGLDLSDAEVKKFAASMEGLQKELKYQFSSTELANIATEAGKLGVATADIDDFAKTISKLSVAVDKVNKIDELSTNMAKIQTIFKLSVPEVEKFGAAMNKLDDISSATADQILTFTQMAGKVGAAFKINQNELAAYGTTLISAGAKAGEAATFMNKFLTVLAAPTNSSKPAQEAITKLGYSVTDLAQRFDKDGSRTMQDFLQRLKTLDSVTQKDVMGRIFGLEHIDNAALLVAQTDNLQKYLKEAGDSVGNIAKLNREFDKMASNSFEGQYRTFVNLTGELGKQIGMTILPGLNEILRGLSPIVQRMVDFVQLHPGVSKYIGFALMATAAFAPLAITLGSVINAVMGIINVGGSLITMLKIIGSLGTVLFPTFTAGFVAIAGAVWTALGVFAPFIIAGAAIGALAALIMHNWQPISGFFQRLFESAMNSAEWFYNGYKQVFDSLGGYLHSVFVTRFMAELEYLATGYKMVFTTMKNYIGSIFTNMIANAKYSGQMLIYSFIQGINSYAQDLINNVSSLMAYIRGYLPSSPAKYGALSDLDKTGGAFTNTFMEGVNNSPLSDFLSNVFTNPQTPTNAGLSIPGASEGSNETTIILEYKPEITGSKIDAEVILSLLRNDQRGLQALINDAADKINRRYYA